MSNEYSMGPGAIILLIDPDQSMAELYSDWLHRKGLVPVAVTSGEQALPIAATADLIITERRLPGWLSGLDLVARLRSSEQTRHIPIILLSRDNSVADRSTSRMAGCNLYLPKPCPPEYLLGRVRRLLRVRRANTRATSAYPVLEKTF
jgi:DNA-binding response OmpR family regulator